MNHLEVFEVREFDNNKKKRLGKNTDGGYVIAELEGTYDCYISAGVSDEESFSKDFLSKYDYLDENDAFAFDGTIKSFPFEYTKNISFINKNIDYFNDENHTNLHQRIKQYKEIFLKMDIEGGEFPWLQSLSIDQLKQFKQIVIEFHGVTDDGWEVDYLTKVKCLKKLLKTHYIIHVHGNNCGGWFGGYFPRVIEITYVNKNQFQQEPPLNTTQEFPIAGLDFPNCSTLYDFHLNYYPFKSSENKN
jgi:hypothetical protein